LSDTYLRTLLAELDLEKEMQWVETRTGFYTDGKLYSMSNTLEFLRFPPLGLADKLRLGVSIFYASKVKDWKRLEKILATDWLRRWSGRHTFERIWLPLLRAKLGENYKVASAAFIWACIARMYAARRTGLKKEMFGYVPGGYARVLERFAEVLVKQQVNIKLGQAVTKVASADHGRVLVRMNDGGNETFDRVVLTMAAPLAARVCAELSTDEQNRLHGVQYQGIICASALIRHPLAGYYVTNITDDGVPFTAVIEMSALVDRKHFDGNALVYLPKYVKSDDPAFCQSDAEIEQRFIEGLMRMYPHLRASDIVAFRISRVRYVLALSTLNYSERLPPMTSSVPGVHIINSAHICNGTLNVNETVQLAEKAAARLVSSSPSAAPALLREESDKTAVLSTSFDR
jgi:protoporphyrinogen oxidase